jgi:ABC-type polysaccharide/polyol phosphate transport system ATPase subunit
LSKKSDAAASSAQGTSMNAIEVHHVHKFYRRYSRRRQFDTLKSALLSGSVLRNLRPDEGFEALRGVSFEVAAGKTVGMIGRNGSGKSTMLKLIAGIGKPTSGRVEVRGRVSALIELGAGFHPEISGRENVFINGMMLGLSRKEIAARFAEIVAFAELEEFIDAPVKTYSSGMYMRLGFSVAIHVDPDVLLVDEVLAVGDEAFTHKCLDRFADLRRRGRTVLLVTHSLDMVSRFCDDAIWMDDGRVRTHGDPRRVIDAYLLDVRAREAEQLAVSRPSATAEPDQPADMFQAVEGRWGSREAEIDAVDLRDGEGHSVNSLSSGSPLLITVRVRSSRPLSDVVVGVGIFSAEGVCCYGTNTSIDGAEPGTLDGSGEITLSIPRLELVEGTYKLDVAIHRPDGTPYDYHRQLYALRIYSNSKDVGIYRPPHAWQCAGALTIQGFREDR